MTLWTAHGFIEQLLLEETYGWHLAKSIPQAGTGFGIASGCSGLWLLNILSILQEMSKSTNALQEVWEDITLSHFSILCSWGIPFYFLSQSMGRRCQEDCHPFPTFNSLAFRSSPEAFTENKNDMYNFRLQ